MASSAILSEYALRAPLQCISSRPTTQVWPTSAPSPESTAAASSGWTASQSATSRCSAPRQAGKGSRWWMSLTNAPLRWAPGFCGPGSPCRHWTLTRSDPATILWRTSAATGKGWTIFRCVSATSVTWTASCPGRRPGKSSQGKSSSWAADSPRSAPSVT